MVNQISFSDRSRRAAAAPAAVDSSSAAPPGATMAPRVVGHGAHETRQPSPRAVNIASQLRDDCYDVVPLVCTVDSIRREVAR